MGAGACTQGGDAAVPQEDITASEKPTQEEPEEAKEEGNEGDKAEAEPEEEEDDGTGEPALAINIVGARGVRNADWMPGSGKSDTYVVVKMDDKELHRTEVVQDSLEPFWREDVNIRKWTPEKKIVFTLWDQDLMSSDYLGKVELDNAAFADVGFNGEITIDEAGDGVRAYLRLKIKLAGKELPPGPPTEVNVTAEKGEYQTWGLDLDTQDNELLYVTEVRPGPFMDANEKLKPEEQVIKSDFLLGVNGVKGSPAAILNEFKLAQTVTLTLARSVETTICFEHKNRKTPLGIEFPVKPSGEELVVVSIEEEGAAAEYNAAQPNEMLKLCPGDRIISVSGFRGKAGELQEKMEAIKKKGKAQVEIMRATGEEAKAHFGLH